MRLSICIISLLVLLAVSVRAQQSVISYQGVIAKDDLAVPDGDYTITVTIYHDSLAANSAWSGWYYVHTSKGIFNVLLGSGDYPLPSASKLDGPLFVGLRIGASAELPLTQLSQAVSAECSRWLDHREENGDGLRLPDQRKRSEGDGEWHGPQHRWQCHV